ncbi:hypothetical protein ACMHYB_55375 [Sorangium sp. So ce1128]
MADRTPDASTVPIDEVIVTLGHPHGDIDTPLRIWMERGPGPRPLVRPIAAKHAKTKQPLPLSVVPMQYRNDTESRDLIARGVIADPWKKTSAPGS